MKIAFVILAYKNPAQLSDLVKSLTHSEHWFFIHIDKTKDITPFENALKKNIGANIIFVERQNSYWGSYNCVKAMLKGLENAFHSPEKFDYFIHLSGQDYPISTIAKIRETLTSAIPKSFLYHFSLPAPNWQNGGMDRLESCSFFCGRKRIVLNRSKKNPFYRFLFIIWKILIRQFDKYKKMYGGEFYFILHRDAIRTLLENRGKYFFLRNRLKYTLIPEEIYIPTLLLQGSGIALPIQNETLRFIPWEETGRSPRTIVENDLQQILNGNYLFARKFDFEQYPNVQKIIDQHIKSQTPYSNERH